MSRLLYDSLAKKDQTYLGKYYVAVKTTNIYCSMSCPCKTPLYENITFFSRIEACLIRGYRECKICRPLNLFVKASNKVPINKKANTYIEWLGKENFPSKSYKQHPLESADDLQAIKGIFQKNTDISLGKYLRIKRVGYLLKNDKKDDNHQEKILFGYIDTPLGEMIACFIKKGLALLEFINRKSLERELVTIKKNIKGYFVHDETERHKKLLQQISEYFNNQRKSFLLELDLIGTEFQKQVWSELMKIPFGKTVSYSYQAKQLHRPDAVRAVASANGKNMISIIVPCHRVITSNGKLAGYGGGIERKRKLLDMESTFT